MTVDPQFSRPAPDSVRLTVGSPWGPRDGHIHHGIDLGMPEGTPLLALADGVITRVQPNVVDEAGRWVGVRYPNGMVSRHLHMVRIGDVAVGQAVRRGQVIGYAGNTGRSSGPHLHLALHAPAELLPAIEADVGKPTGGWGPSSKYGVAIPAEPWVPVDGYRLTTLAKLAAQGIPTYVSRARWTPTQTKGAIVIGALGLALVGVGLAVRYRRRKDAGLGDARSPFEDVELAGVAGPDDWWRGRDPARLPDKLCYATKQDALNVFRDENRETIENWGGLDAKARPSDFDAINHKYGVKADTLSKAMWAAMPARRPFCLENIDVEALNDTAPGRAGTGFRLPAWVHERGYTDEQAEHYRTRAELEVDAPAEPVRYRRVEATKIGTDGRRRTHANLKAFDRDCGKRARRADVGCTLTNLRRLRDGSGLATVKIHSHRPVTPGTWRLHLDSFDGLRQYLEMRAADVTGDKRQRWGAEDVRVADDAVPF